MNWFRRQVPQDRRLICGSVFKLVRGSKHEGEGYAVE